MKHFVMLLLMVATTCALAETREVRVGDVVAISTDVANAPRWISKMLGLSYSARERDDGSELSSAILSQLTSSGFRTRGEEATFIYDTNVIFDGRASDFIKMINALKYEANERSKTKEIHATSVATGLATCMIGLCGLNSLNQVAGVGASAIEARLPDISRITDMDAQVYAAEVCDSTTCAYAVVYSNSAGVQKSDLHSVMNNQGIKMVLSLN